MKVLLIYNTMDLPETELAISVAKQGVKVDVICNPERGYHGLLDKNSMGVEYLVFKSKFDLKAICRLRRKLKDANYDIVHAFTARSLAAVNIACLGLSVSTKVAAYRGAMGNVYYWDPLSWLTYLNPRLAKINCVSKAVRDSLAQAGVPAGKLVCIYKGHELAWYEQESKADLSSWGVPENAFVVGCVANTRPNKGVDVFLEAAEALSEHQEIHFLLVGDVRDKEIFKLIDHLKLRDRIHCTGWQKDAFKIIGALDVLVMPTKKTEGFPKAVIEAMSQQVTPIVTSVGGMLELVRHEKDGLHVPPANVEKLAEAIEILYQNPEMRKNFGGAAQERINTTFKASKTTTETISFYNDLLKDTSG